MYLLQVNLCLFSAHSSGTKGKEPGRQEDGGGWPGAAGQLAPWAYLQGCVAVLFLSQRNAASCLLQEGDQDMGEISGRRSLFSGHGSWWPRG